MKTGTAVWMWVLLGCATTPTAPPPSTAPSLTLSDVSKALPTKATQRGDWARAIMGGIEGAGKTLTAERACAVVAVIEQESGFVADPAVQNLPAITRNGLQAKLAGLGALAEPTLAALLAIKLEDGDSINEHIGRLRTERDLDVLFRQMAREFEGNHPTTFALASVMGAVMGRGGVRDLNPVTTAGSMQVKVSFASEHAGVASDDEVRDALYTLEGGVRFGSLRLLGYVAHYTDIKHRFADYNAGPYASRNAAFQQQLSELLGTRLVLDGDLLAYQKDGNARGEDSASMTALLQFAATHRLSERTVRRDVAKEKSIDFEDTATWRAVKQAWRDNHDTEPAYARIPDVELDSPKLKTTRTTSWFADAVHRRYNACRARI
jgi:hypothetical protein